MENKKYDLVIIGAGPQGLVAAKTYHLVHPEAKITIIDSNSTLGGTWSKERLYDDLKTNNLLGTFEFPDFPVNGKLYGVQKGETLPGQTAHQYLCDYAQKFGIYDKIQFNTTVVRLEKGDVGGWLLDVVDGEAASGKSASGGRLQAERVIISSGLTSQPNIPDFQGRDDFKGTIFHIKDFGKQSSDIDSSSRVVVIGGAKSAYDAVYSYATAGHSIHWIIRPDGRGPAWMPPSYVTPLKLWLEQLVTTRFLSWFTACTWQHADGYPWARWFLHQTWLGKLMVTGLGKVMDADLNDLIGYEKHESTRALKPWFSSLKVGTNLSIMTYPTDVLEYVRSGQVKVHIANIERLSENAAELSTGETVPADTIFCATGWNLVPSFLKGLEEELGLSHPSGEDDKLGEKADAAILGQFPHLAKQRFPRVPMLEDSSSRYNDNESSSISRVKSSRATTGFRLYRFMVPPRYFNERSIVCASSAHTIRFLTEAHVKALWITAFFDGKLATQQQADASSVDEIEYEAALHARCGKWTTPGGYAEKVPDFTFQHLPMLDMLFSDLGVERWRKLRAEKEKGGWFSSIRGRLREIFEPYMPQDYAGIVDEWQEGSGAQTKLE